MPSSPFATHISTEHLCYENAVRRSSLASDYDVDKRLITRCTSTASRLCSPTATLAVPSRTPSWRGARRPRGIERETRVANVSSFIYVCDVTLSAYPHRASLKNMPGHGGIRTYDLWNTSPMLFQLSYAVRTVRVSDISEQYLVPSIPMCSSNTNFFFSALFKDS